MMMRTGLAGHDGWDRAGEAPRNTNNEKAKRPANAVMEVFFILFLG
jgi:hypothetical protein